VEARHATGHGKIVAEGAVTVDLRKVSKNALDEIHGVGPLRVTREFSLNPRWIRRFGDYLGLLKICCLFAHETFDRLCQRGKSAAWPLNLSILWIIAFSGISTGDRIAGRVFRWTKGTAKAAVPKTQCALRGFNRLRKKGRFRQKRMKSVPQGLKAS
jgi:hypothetical protein